MSFKIKILQPRTECSIAEDSHWSTWDLQRQHLPHFPPSYPNKIWNIVCSSNYPPMCYFRSVGNAVFHISSNLCEIIISSNWLQKHMTACEHLSAHLHVHSVEWQKINVKNTALQKTVGALLCCAGWYDKAQLVCRAKGGSSWMQGKVQTPELCCRVATALRKLEPSP